VFDERSPLRPIITPGKKTPPTAERSQAVLCTVKSVLVTPLLSGDQLVPSKCRMMPTAPTANTSVAERPHTL
jgi:hypothetical protein